MANVLIVDDDTTICRLLIEMVERDGHDATSVFTLGEGVQAAGLNSFDLVLLDVELPDGNGLEAIPVFRGTDSAPEVIIITGVGHPDGAEIAIANGAWDYIQKPISPRKVILPLTRVLQYRAEVAKARKPLVALKREGIVGSSAQITACFDSLAHLAWGDANVLITGETGTGKELFAKAIHANSHRAQKDFVVIDCAALPPTLIESSLFGFEKGAFTSADAAQSGLIKLADGGTLFLDEVAELPLSLQTTFLRVLQEHRFRSIGGKKEIESDFRLVAATNRDIDKMCRDGDFRSDLLYRLRAATLDLPPLRQRSGDIRELILHYTPVICQKYGIETKGFSPDFFDAVCAYDWPGNVRELVNTLKGVLSETRHQPTLYPLHLPNYIRTHIARASVRTTTARPALETPQVNVSTPISPPRYKDYKEGVLLRAESKYFKDLMSFVKGSIKDACKISGLSRTQVYTLLKKHGISRLGWDAPANPS